MPPAAFRSEGYDPAYGARPLKRIIQQRIENPLAAKILSVNLSMAKRFRVDVNSSKQDLVLKRRSNFGRDLQPRRQNTPAE